MSSLLDRAGLEVVRVRVRYALHRGRHGRSRTPEEYQFETEAVDDTGQEWDVYNRSEHPDA